MRRILVTGAAGGEQGSTGAQIVALLKRKGEFVRALVHRRDERSARLEEQGVEVVVGDFLEPNSMREALRGMQSAYFAYQVQPGLLEATAIFAQAAREARVEAIVNLSQVSASEAALSPTSREHYWSERILDWALPGVTHLRGAVFFENFRRQTVAQIAASATFRMPLGSSGTKLPMVGAETIARVAAAILADPAGHSGHTYPLIGEVLSVGEIAQTLGAILGSPVHYEELSDQAWRQHFEARNGLGNPVQIEHLSRLWMTLRKASEQHVVFEATASQIHQLSGQAPQSFDQFVRQNVAAFQNSRLD